VIKTKAEIAELERQPVTSASKNDTSGGAVTQGDNPAYVALASQLASTQADIKSIKKQIQDISQQKNNYQRRIEATPKLRRNTVP